jgi:hypothetical protein
MMYPSFVFKYVTIHFWLNDVPRLGLKHKTAQYLPNDDLEFPSQVQDCCIFGVMMCSGPVLRYMAVHFFAE